MTILFLLIVLYKSWTAAQLDFSVLLHNDYEQMITQSEELYINRVCAETFPTRTGNVRSSEIITSYLWREREKEREKQRLITVYEFFPTSPAIAKCSMKKFIRVFMPFSEYISDSRTHPLPTTISRNSDVSITNWGTYKKWTKNTKPN